MLVSEKVSMRGSPAASLACQDELSVPGRARAVSPEFPETPGVFLVPGEDKDVGGKRAWDLHLLTLH